MPSDGSGAVTTYGPARRTLAFVAGLLMLLVGLGLGLLFLGALTGKLVEHSLSAVSLAEAFVIVIAGTIVCGAFAAMGVRRLRAAIRGAEEPPAPVLQRTDSWYRRNWYSVGLSIGLAFVALAVFVAGPRAVLSRTGALPARVGWYLLVTYLVLPIHVAIHEVGHAIVASLLGFRFLSLRIGWLSVRRAANGPQISWARPGLTEALGLHQALPPDGAFLPIRTAIWAAAGPLATLLAAFACRAAVLYMNGQEVGLAASAGSQALQMGWWMGLVLATVNALPFQSRGGLLTDGGIVLRSLSPPTPAARMQQRFLQEWGAGRRPKAWGLAPEDFLAVAEGAGAERDALYLAAAALAIDRGDDRGASDILEQALGGPAVGSQWRPELLLQAAMIAAFAGRPAEARGLLAQVGPWQTLPEYPLLAGAVADACDGAFDAAASGLRSWEGAMTQTGMASSIRVGNEWAVERLRAMLAAEPRGSGAECS